MELFINSRFIDKLDELESKAYTEKNRFMVDSYYELYKLITSGLKINTDLNEKEITSNFDIVGNKNYNNLKSVISTNYIKQNGTRFTQFPISIPSNLNAYYFLEDANNHFEKYGVAFVNNLNKYNQFYPECTLNSAPFEDDYSVITNVVPPCNSMFIVDKYLFSNEKKIENLVKFIEIFKNDELKIDFHLSILSSYENNNKTIPPKIFEFAHNKLSKLNNLEFKIYLDNRIPDPGDDRLIYTSYSKGNIGHPFDDRKTYFTQEFLGTAKNVKQEYDIFVKDLNFWGNFIKKIPAKMGLLVTQYGNLTSENRLFSVK